MNTKEQLAEIQRLSDEVDAKIAQLLKAKAERAAAQAERAAAQAERAAAQAERAVAKAKRAAAQAERDARHVAFEVTREQRWRKALGCLGAMNARSSVGTRLFVLDPEHDLEQFTALAAERVIALEEYHIAYGVSQATSRLNCTLGFCTQEGFYRRVTFGQYSLSSEAKQDLWCYYETYFGEDSTDASSGDASPGVLLDHSGCFHELIKLAEAGSLPLIYEHEDFDSAGHLILLVERCIEALGGRTYVKDGWPRTSCFPQLLDQLVVEHHKLTKSSMPLSEDVIAALSGIIVPARSLVKYGLKFKILSHQTQLNSNLPRDKDAIARREPTVTDRLLPKLLPYILQLLEPGRLLVLLLKVSYEVPDLIGDIFLSNLSLRRHVFQLLLTSRPGGCVLPLWLRGVITIMNLDSMEGRFPKRESVAVQKVLEIFRNALLGLGPAVIAATTAEASPIPVEGIVVGDHATASRSLLPDSRRESGNELDHDAPDTASSSSYNLSESEQPDSNSEIGSETGSQSSSTESTTPPSPHSLLLSESSTFFSPRGRNDSECPQRPNTTTTAQSRSVSPS